MRGFHNYGFFEKTVEASTCYFSAITIAELFGGVRESKERHLLEKFLKSFEPIALNEQIAQTAGIYRRDYGKSHGTGLADALIAATSSNVTLVTLNKKHFPMLEKLHIPYHKT